MGVDRRAFLTRTGLALGAAALAGPTLRGGADASPSPSTPRLDDWSAVRDLFALSREYVQLGGLYLASHPTPVREAIEAHRRGLDENPVYYLQQNGRRLESATLRAAAAYLGAAPTDVALTDSTTMGLGLLYNGLHVRAGQDVLTTTHDFFATHEALGLKATRSGASVRQVPLYERIGTVSQDEIVERVRQTIGPTTRVVAVTWVHSSTGLKLPIRRIADVVAEANAGRDEADRALLCVDGVHGLGVEDATMPELGADFFVAGCHKWLFGPRGTGFVWGHPRAWPAAGPTIPSFGDASAPGGAMTPGGFHSFEHRWALAEAFELHRAIGKARVGARIHELARQMKEGLAAMPHVALHTPRDEALSAGIVCFDVRGMPPQSVVAHLGQWRVIATVTPYSPSHARVAPGLLNSPEEVDAALAAIHALA